MEERRGDRDLVKIFFKLEEGAPTATETLWALSEGPAEPTVFILDSSPFYAFGVSYLDRVFATKAKDGALEFSGVAARGGHSTYRVFLVEGVQQGQFGEYWRRLENLGCTYEGANQRLYAIDVPPSSDIYKAYSVLEQGERAGIWDFEEAHVGHDLKDQN